QQDYVLMAGVLRDSDPRQALELMRQSNDLKDSIFNDASSKLSAQYAMEFESKQKQLTIEEQQHSLTTQRLIIIATSIAVLLLLVGCVALFLINWLRSKAQRAEKNAKQMKDLFFTNVTHEFRTPLTVILGEAKSLRIADKTLSNQPRYNAIINQGNHLLDLVNQLLHMSKVRTSMGSLQWQNGDISTMVNMIVENMRVLAENRNITITTTFDNSDFNIDFVPEYCHSIVTNLIGNSLKFTPKRCTVGCGAVVVSLETCNSVFL
ncbi:MAG: HAMP domain-containing histidine kinase, partial [Acetobacter sp.]|nr:HAMP domain-containing histidine kinase [Acetobacter sp.]